MGAERRDPRIGVLEAEIFRRRTEEEKRLFNIAAVLHGALEWSLGLAGDMLELKLRDLGAFGGVISEDEKAVMVNSIDKYVYACELVGLEPYEKLVEWFDANS